MCSKIFLLVKFCPWIWSYQCQEDIHLLNRLKVMITTQMFPMMGSTKGHPKWGSVSHCCALFMMSLISNTMLSLMPLCLANSLWKPKTSLFSSSLPVCRTRPLLIIYGLLWNERDIWTLHSSAGGTELSTSFNQQSHSFNAKETRCVMTLKHTHYWHGNFEHWSHPSLAGVLLEGFGRKYLHFVVYCRFHRHALYWLNVWTICT